MIDSPIGDVRFSVKSSLCPWSDDPTEAVVRVKARITVYRESRGVSVTAGKMRFLVVRGGEAERNRFELSMACDAYSQDLNFAYSAVFDEEDVRPELGIEAQTEDFIYLERLVFRPRHRRTGVAAQAVQTALATFCPGGLLIAPRSIDLTAADRAALGFKEAADKDFVFLDGSALRPAEKSE